MTAKISYSTASREFGKGQYRQALQTLNQLLEIAPDAKTYALLAKTFLKLGLRSDAATIYDLAARQEDVNAMEYRRKAMNLHFECGNDDDALLAAKGLFETNPNDPDVAYVLGTIFGKRGKVEILDGIRKPLLNSSNPDHLMLAVKLLNEELGNVNNFLTVGKVLQKTPRDNAVRGLYLVQARDLNDYAAIAKHQPIVEAAVAKGDLRAVASETPFYNLFWSGDEKLNRAAVSGTPDPLPDATQRRREMPHAWSDKIRVGYLSADFWEYHATMKLLRNVLERHDRDRFEITLFCHTPAGALAHVAVDRSAWGRVVSIGDLSLVEAAKVIRAQGIDILVDLKGHTKDSKVGILNLQTAPIHVAWLGFPGSTVNVDLDYIIGDRHVLPDSSKPFYHEKFCRLPDTYQPNDSVNRAPLQPLSREELGLPQDAFLFASFNHNRKISPAVLDLWIRILKRTKDSKLLLLTTNEHAQENIRAKIVSEGVAGNRIIFTPKVDYVQHLNRLQAFDLGLDTFPVNGHTTTSEQLWGGLPVITMKGTNFASRVSESLLNAIGLPELVAEDRDAYVELAVSCYENPDKVAAYKAKLEQNRFVAPLFDSERFCRHLESAYETMADRARKGLEPDHFDVPALPPRTSPFM